MFLYQGQYYTLQQLINLINGVFMTDLKASKECGKQAQFALDKAVKLMLVGEYDEAEKLTDLYHALINQSKSLLTNKG